MELGHTQTNIKLGSWRPDAQHPEWNDEKVEKDLDLNLNPVDCLLIQLCLKTYDINILR